MAHARALDLWGAWEGAGLPSALLPLQLETLSLPQNRLTSLAGLPPTLTQLYVQSNSLPFAELAHLRGCPGLQYFMVAGNPAAAHPLCTHACLLLCPLLKALDATPVTPELRAQAELRRADVEAALGPAAAAPPAQDPVLAAVLLLLPLLTPASLQAVLAQARGLQR
jgi:hypothetical protein